MEIGEKVGEGAGSEAYAWGDDEVIKLFKPGTDRRVVEYEVFVTRTAFEAGAPAPEVRGVLEVGGRPGIIFPRYRGETLLQMIVGRRIGPGDAGTIMARLAHSLHAPRYQTSLRTFRQWAMGSIDRLRRNGVEPDVLENVQRTLMDLPESGPLCHGDLHADNILMTADGPVAIDWISALNASPLMDVARQHLTFTMMLTGGQDSSAGVRGEQLTGPRREADAAFVRTYAELTDTSPEDLLTAIAPYMPVMAAMRMMESACTDDERRVLTAYIRTAS